uniref:Uncharacterized protein n=1 Tax=Caenorhabditis japonica TaxID=281687 RepID=A0A8R1IZ93_CAEJA
MKLAQIRDEYEAEMEMNKTQFDDQYAYEKGRYIDYFTALIAEKQRRADMVGNFLGAFLSLPPVPTKETEQPVLTKEAYEGRTTRSRSKSVKKEEEVVERRGRKPKKQIPEKEKMSKRIKEKRKTP